MALCARQIAETDRDGDGLTDEEELAGFPTITFDNGKAILDAVVHTDPDNPDTDGDGLCDGGEADGIKVFVNNHLTRFFSNPTLMDSDGDDFPDKFEVDRRTNPLDPDDHT